MPRLGNEGNSNARQLTPVKLGRRNEQSQLTAQHPLWLRLSTWKPSPFPSRVRRPMTMGLPTTATMLERKPVRTQTIHSSRDS